MKGEINGEWYCSANSYFESDVQGRCSAAMICTDKIVHFNCKGKQCDCYHRKWPTPQQYEEEYGEPYPDEAAVYGKLNYGNAQWVISSYRYVKCAFAYDMSHLHIVCACAPFGPPPKDWRPE